MTTEAALLESLLRASLLLGVVVALSTLPSRAPAARHAALLVALLALLVMPALSLVAPASPLGLPALISAFPASAGPASVAASVAEAGVHADTASGGVSRVLAALAVAWALGAALLLGRALIGLASVFRLRRAARATGRIFPAGRRGARVVVSPAVDVPAAVGFLCPAVLLPREALRWAAEERRAVLAHELAHLRRRDPWALLLATVIRALHWPNPLVWLAHRQLRAASELACDRAAVAAGVPADRYAALLVRLVRSAAGPRPTLAPGIARPHGLSDRVRALVRTTPGDGRGAADRLRRGPAAAGVVAIATLWLAVSPVDLGAAGDWAERYGISDSLAGLILRAAAAEGIEPALAFGLVSVESGFDPSRVSRSGAVGLAQVLPETAATLDPGVTKETLGDPETSLRLGLRLLGDYLGRFDGDRERALRAYHLGPASAGRAEAPYPAAVLAAAGAPSGRRTDRLAPRPPE